MTRTFLVSWVAALMLALALAGCGDDDGPGSVDGGGGGALDSGGGARDAGGGGAVDSGGGGAIDASGGGAIDAGGSTPVDAGGQPDGGVVTRPDASGAAPGTCRPGPCPMECVRAFTCVTACGGPETICGCCPCGAGSIDSITCRTDDS